MANEIEIKPLIKVLPPLVNGASHRGHDAFWRGNLIVRRVKDKATGMPAEIVTACLSNAITILRYHEDWIGLIAYNEFVDAIVSTRTPPWGSCDAPKEAKHGEWTDNDTIRLASWFARNEGLHLGVQIIEQAIAVISDTNTIHPVRDYLKSVVWDGKQRLPRLFADYFGAEHTPYLEAIGIRWMVSAVARVMRPGCQADCMVVFESSQQGQKKSTGIEVLAGTEWFSDTPFVPGDKDSYQGLRGVWIYEFGELTHVRAADVEKTKNFVSARIDRYRPSFGKRTRAFPRQCVFAGTTNEDTYLQDRTGNRRFWPVRVLRMVDIEAIARDRDQLWAEARSRYESQERWYADTEEVRALCEKEQETRVNPDAWMEIVAEWIAAPKLHDQAGLFDTSDGITTKDILLHALKMRPCEMKKSDEMRAGSTLRSLGYERSKWPVTRGEARVHVYLRV